MPGLCCLVTPQPDPGIGRRLTAMARAIQYSPRYRVASVVTPRVALATVDVDPAFAARPFESSDVTVLCYGYVFFPDDPPGRRAYEATDTCARIARRYLDEPRGFMQDLDGKFLLAVHDHRTGEVMVINDRHALCPVYYALDGGLVLAPEVKAVVAGLEREPARDRVGIEEFLLFDFPLAQRTTFDGIHCLPSAAIVSCGHSAPSLTQYWDYSLSPRPTQAGFEESAAEAERLMAHAVAKGSSRALRMLYPLSGGLDSRFIAAHAARQAAAIDTVTYGERASRELKYGAECARVLGARHHEYPHSPGMFIEHGKEFAWRTDGMCGIQHAHAMPYLVHLAGCFDLQQNGYLGDLIAGGHDHPLPEGLSLDSRVDHLVAAFAAFRGFSGRLYPRLKDIFQWDAIRHDLHGALAAATRQNPERTAIQYFYFSPRGPCATARMMYAGTTYIEQYFPFMERSYLDFMLGLSPEYRVGQYLYRYLLERQGSEIAGVPFLSSGGLRVPPTVWQRVVARARTSEALLKYPLEFVTLGRLHWRRSTTQYAYDRWLRRELREWKEQLLARFSTRGWLDTAFLNRVSLLQQYAVDHQHLFLYNVIACELHAEALAERSEPQP